MTYEKPYIGCLVGTAFQRLTSQLENALKEASLDITASEYMILRALYSTDGLQQCEIADMVGKDKGSVSRSVSGLVRKGLVRTEQVSYKCCRVWLSECASAIRGKIMDIAARRHEALLSMISEKDVATFVNVLRKIISE